MTNKSKTKSIFLFLKYLTLQGKVAARAPNATKICIFFYFSGQTQKGNKHYYLVDILTMAFQTEPERAIMC